jgi:hypothetical protein
MRACLRTTAAHANAPPNPKKLSVTANRTGFPPANDYSSADEIFGESARAARRRPRTPPSHEALKKVYGLAPVPDVDGPRNQNERARAELVNLHKI